MQTEFQGKKFTVAGPANLYKWAKNFGRLQRNFFDEEVVLRRDKQISDFVKLNGFNNPYLVIDTDILQCLEDVEVPTLDKADIVIVTDQKFSRYPCPIIIEHIHQYLDQCASLYVCFNSTYINIDNSFHDTTLNNEYNMAITEWLKKNVAANIIDLSLDIEEKGKAFTWVVPDRHYYIFK